MKHCTLVHSILIFWLTFLATPAFSQISQIASSMKNDTENFSFEMLPDRTEPQDESRSWIRDNRREANAWREQEKVYDQLRSSTRYGNGDVNDRNMIAFHRTLNEADYSSGFMQMMFSPVPRLNADSFVVNRSRRKFKIVRANGEVDFDQIRSSRLGVTPKIDSRVDQAELAWHRVLSAVRAGRVPEYEVKKFIGKMRHVNSVLDELYRRRSKPSRAQRFAIHICQIATSLLHPDRLDEMRVYLEGYNFPGGNLRQLCEFMERHDIGPAPGSEANSYLAPLCDRLAEQAAAREDLNKLSEYRSESNHPGGRIH